MLNFPISKIYLLLAIIFTAMNGGNYGEVRKKKRVTIKSFYLKILVTNKTHIEHVVQNKTS